MTRDRLGYLHPSGAITRNILIPKYYDPSIEDRLDELAHTHDLYRLGDLIDDGDCDVQSGHDIGKITYGTGSIPFVRTSDLSDWELKADPKHGVSEEIYGSYSPDKQDVQSGDLFMVKDGTYLVGTAAYVTEADLPLLYQSHLLRIRVQETSPVSAVLLLTGLSSPIVRRQIRARQFSAGILDKIESRYRELTIPVPKGRLRERLHREALQLVERRVELRERLRRIPYWIQGDVDSPEDPVVRPEPDEGLGEARLGFIRGSYDIENSFIPKYYDPGLDLRLKELSQDFELTSISELVERGILSAFTGVEVGKMAYGTGSVPFVRTSDLSNWELKGDPKQRVDSEIFQALGEKLDARPGDILLVRDGTYLVGTSAIVSELDGDLLFSGGVYKIRCERPDVLDPYLLIAILNLPIVRRQMKSKQFTRDIIDTLGKRLFEVVLPLPKDKRRRKKIATTVYKTVTERAKLRERAKKLAIEIQGGVVDVAERELLLEESS